MDEEENIILQKVHCQFLDS